MFTIHHGLGGHAAHVEWQPTKAMRLSALLGTLIVASIAVNALTILADSHLRQRQLHDCSTIGEEADRLACYDKPARQPAPQPAKGANAPALFIPSDGRTSQRVTPERTPPSSCIAACTKGGVRLCLPHPHL